MSSHSEMCCCARMGEYCRCDSYLTDLTTQTGTIFDTSDVQQLYTPPITTPTPPAPHPRTNGVFNGSRSLGAGYGEGNRLRNDDLAILDRLPRSTDPNAPRYAASIDIDSDSSSGSTPPVPTRRSQHTSTVTSADTSHHSHHPPSQPIYGNTGRTLGTPAITRPLARVNLQRNQTTGDTDARSVPPLNVRPRNASDGSPLSHPPSRNNEDIALRNRHPSRRYSNRDPPRTNLSSVYAPRDAFYQSQSTHRQPPSNSRKQDETDSESESD